MRPVNGSEHFRPFVADVETCRYEGYQHLRWPQLWHFVSKASRMAGPSTVRVPCMRCFLGLAHMFHMRRRNERTAWRGDCLCLRRNSEASRSSSHGRRFGRHRLKSTAVRFVVQFYQGCLLPVDHHAQRAYCARRGQLPWTSCIIEYFSS